MAGDSASHDFAGNKYYAAVGGIALLVAVSTIALILRLYVRARFMKGTGLDDYLLVIAHGFSLALCACFFAIPYVDLVAVEQMLPSARLNILTLVALMSYCLETLFFKACLTVFFLKISQQRWQRLLLLGSVILYLLLLTSFMMVMLFRCGVPTLATIEHVVGSNECTVGWNILYPVGISVAALNTFSFLVFSLIPSLHALNRSQLSGGARRAVIVLTILAICGCSVSAIRIGLVWTLHPGPFFYSHAGRMHVLSSVEACMATLIVSLASLRPLLTLWREKAGRAWAHWQGREWSQDFEAERRMVPRFHMNPTTVAPHYSIDENLFRGLGILPDCSDEKPMAPPLKQNRGQKHWNTMQMASISEVMFTSVEPTRRLSTV